MKVLRITNSDRYEVSDKGRVWKSGPKRHGPIPELRIPVHGFAWGAGYRAFLRVATPRWAATSFGVFIKLQEVGANADLEDRWLIVPRTGGATKDATDGYFAGIAEETGFSVKDITKAVEVLTHKEVAWLDWVEVDDDSRTVREFPENPALCATCYDLLCKSESSSISNKEKTVSEKIDELDGVKCEGAMDTPEVRNAVVEWLTHHRQIANPYKNSRTQFKKLFKKYPTPEEFIAAVDHSIANNYQGLYGPGDQNGTNGKVGGAFRRASSPARPGSRYGPESGTVIGPDGKIVKANSDNGSEVDG